MSAGRWPAEDQRSQAVEIRSRTPRACLPAPPAGAPGRPRTLPKSTLLREASSRRACEREREGKGPHSHPGQSGQGLGGRTPFQRRALPGPPGALQANSAFRQFARALISPTRLLALVQGRALGATRGGAARPLRVRGGDQVPIQGRRRRGARRVPPPVTRAPSVRRSVLEVPAKVPAQRFLVHRTKPAEKSFDFMVRGVCRILIVQFAMAERQPTCAARSWLAYSRTR